MAEIGRRKGQRIVGEARDRMMQTLSKEYAAGKSIRELAVNHNISIGLSRNLLVQAGAPLRGRGGSASKKRSRRVQ